MTILNPWVETLSLREQGTLLAAIRGCDMAEKFPLESAELQMFACIRWIVLRPADEREVGSESECFMRSINPDQFKPSSFGTYALHWVAYAMHALEVIGYQHPDGMISGPCLVMYQSICRMLHVPPETRRAMIERLTGDRIISGTVVS